MTIYVYSSHVILFRFVRKANAFISFSQYASVVLPALHFFGRALSNSTAIEGPVSLLQRAGDVCQAYEPPTGNITLTSKAPAAIWFCCLLTRQINITARISSSWRQLRN